MLISLFLVFYHDLTTISYDLIMISIATFGTPGGRSLGGGAPLCVGCDSPWQSRALNRSQHHGRLPLPPLFRCPLACSAEWLERHAPISHIRRAPLRGIP